MTYLPYRRQFVKCYINQVLHFDTTTTSRAEGGHAILKRQLGSSHGDLKIVVNAISLLLTNELHDHILAVNEAKMRVSLRLRKSIFQRISSYVSPHALRKVLEQYSLVVDKPTVLQSCIDAFTTTLGLPCCHKIQQRMYEPEGCLLIKIFIPIEGKVAHF